MVQGTEDQGSTPGEDRLDIAFEIDFAIRGSQSAYPGNDDEKPPSCSSQEASEN